MEFNKEDRKIESSDHFQLLVDYKIKKEKGTANTSQMLFDLESSISKSDLKDYLLSNKYFESFINVSIRNPFMRKMRYRFGEGKTLVIEEKKINNIDPSEVFKDDDIGFMPVKITLFQLENSSAILFQFNHIYIDNNGVKNLIRSFNGEEFDFLKTTTTKQNSFSTRYKNMIVLSVKMMKKWYEKKAFIHSKNKGPIKKNYIIDTLTEEETAHIKGKIKRSHHIESISSILMGACCIGVKELLTNREEELKEFIFQQPFDFSSKRERPYILGNRFSFIHYRLQPDQVTNLSELEYELNRQTLQQIKERTPYQFIDLESIFRNFPLAFHLWMISLPAKGKMTTFAYTFIDETKIIDEFAGIKVLDIINTPPVMRKPPITFGFAYYDGKFRTVQSYDSNAIEKSEAELLFKSIKELLLA